VAVGIEVDLKTGVAAIVAIVAAVAAVVVEVEVAEIRQMQKQGDFCASYQPPVVDDNYLAKYFDSRVFPL
jgi:hypothetical protein